jgi:hypothetical protein
VIFFLKGGSTITRGPSLPHQIYLHIIQQNIDCQDIESIEVFGVKHEQRKVVWKGGADE